MGTRSVGRLPGVAGAPPGTRDGLYERHLLFDNAVDLAAAGARERFEAFARSVTRRASRIRLTGMPS